MTEIKVWPKLAKIHTRDTLTRVDIDAFGICIDGMNGVMNKGCLMKHIDGSRGYITMLNALLSTWVIHHLDSDEETGNFKSIDELLEAGWVAV